MSPALYEDQGSSWRFTICYQPMAYTLTAKRSQHTRSQDHGHDGLLGGSEIYSLRNCSPIMWL